MPNEDTTTKFKVDISQLKKAMQDARRQISLANSEFKSSSSAMGDWENSADGVSAKLKQLDSVLKSQNKILDSLEQQYEAVAAEQGEGSAAAERLKISINNQKAAINKTEREIASYSDRLEEVQDAEKQAAKTGKTVAEVLDEMGNEAVEANDGFTVLKGGLAVLAGNLMTGFLNGLKEGAKTLLGLSEETREYRAEMAKLETAFTTAGYSTEAATGVYKDFYAVLGDEGQAVEAVNHLAKLTDSEKDLATWTDICTGVYATFGDSLPIEGLTEAANETAKTGTVTGSLADALNWAGISEDDFNDKLAKCSSEQERQKLIMDTLNGTYSEAGALYEETNKSVMDANRAQSDYTDTLAALGEKVEPVMTAIKIGVTDLLKAFMGLLDGVDMEAFVGKIQEAFSFLVNEVLPVVVEGFGKLVEGIGSLLDWVQRLSPLLVGLGVALAGLAIVGLVQNFTAIAGAVKTWMMSTKLMTAAQWLLNAAMSANPITLIVIAIAALVAAFVVLWNKSETFRNFWIGLWDKVKSIAASAKDWILNAVGAIGDFFTETLPNAIETGKTYISEKIDAITSFFTETIPNAIGAVKDWIVSNWQSILAFLINPFAGLFTYFYQNNSKFREFVDNAVNQIKELPGKVWTWLLNTINKVKIWATNMIDKAKETALNFINKVVSYIKQLPGKIWTWLVNVVTKIVTWRANMIKKAIEVGTNFINKIVEYFRQLPGKVWTWLVNVVSKVTTWASNMAAKAREAGQNFVNKVVDLISDLPGKIWTWLQSVIDKVASWGASLAAKGKAAAQQLVSSVVEKVQELPGKMLTVGKNLVEGIWEGISGATTWIKNKIKSWVGNVETFLKNLFGIGSPSKLMEEEIGQWLPKGIAVGIDKNAKSVLSSMQNLVNGTVGVARNSLANTGRLVGSHGVSPVTAGVGNVTNNYYQTINSPKQLSRFEIYRQSKNLLGLKGGS